MNFDSLDDIIAHFKFDIKDADDVKKELKNLIKEVHPDRNKGEFKSDQDKTFFYEIQSALEYLEKLNPNVSLSTQNDITALTKVLTELALTKKEDTLAEIVEKKSSSLTVKLQDSINSFHKLNTSPKITGIVATTIITALWAFPSVVKEHPLLKFLYNYNVEFTLVWVISLAFMGMLWVKINSSEKYDAEIKRSYKLESTQNYIFTLFIRWMKANHINYEIIENKRIVTFSKDDLINFLTSRFRYLQRKLKGKQTLHNYELEKEIKRIEESGEFEKEIYRQRRSSPFSIFFNFLPKPGEIDLEIAQLICDLIIERLTTKGVVTKSEFKSLSDKFIYEDDY